MTDVHYSDDLTLLASALAQANYQLPNLKPAARCVILYVNVDKTDFMFFKLAGAISTSNGKPLKLVHQFTYLGNYISSTESDVNIHIGKAWTATDRFLITWKSDLSDRIKREFFQALSVLLYGCTIWTLRKLGEKARWKLHQVATCCFEQILVGSNPNHCSTATCFPSH